MGRQPEYGSWRFMHEDQGKQQQATGMIRKEEGMTWTNLPETPHVAFNPARDSPVWTETKK
jgi:hypothetical protein